MDRVGNKLRFSTETLKVSNNEPSSIAKYNSLSNNINRAILSHATQQVACAIRKPPTSMSGTPTENNSPSHDDADEPLPTNFHHPFTPYGVQLEFMRAVYDVLQKGNGQVGILESPTGTVSTATFSSFPYSHPIDPNT